jgi:phage terminase large subunit GpA-like protein
MTYAKHIVAEVQTEEFVRGVLVRKWTNKHSRPNHYLDASYMANVAANIKGIRLLRQPEEMKPAKSAPRQVEVEQQTESRPYLASER